MEPVQCMHSPRPMRGVALHERHALAAFCQASASDSTTTFRCLNADALAQLAEQLGGDESCRSKVLSAALLRRLVHGHRSKLVGMSSPATWEATLAQVDVLPESLGAHLADKHGGYPKTWLDAIQQLQIHAQGSKEKLWRLLDSHAILEYVPVQCQTCGHVVPDDIRSGKSDVEVGLREVAPTPEELPFVRAGWFRGARGAVVFELRCVPCGALSRWFRTSEPRVMLRPRWGKLCGEQEDLRSWLGGALGVSQRKAYPLDWDHVWSEADLSDVSTSRRWSVLDGSARNFAVRLDEGIGAWTFVLALGDCAESCEDVTEEYLRCADDEGGGRADVEHAGRMRGYRERVLSARSDATGESTQAGTLNGYLLHTAGFSSQHITAVLRRAFRDYGNRAWWDLYEMDVDPAIGASEEHT